MDKKSDTAMIKKDVPPPIRWDVLAVFLGTGLVTLTLVPLYGFFYGYNIWLWLGFALFILWNSLSITAGYHRLWSHKSYQAHPAVRLIFALGGALSIQNSIMVWCSNHRNHHRFTDDIGQDPYSAQKGLWYSHIGWMLRDYPAAEIDWRNIKDLKQDWVVNWQHRYYWSLVIIMNLIIPLGLGFIVGDIWGGLLLIGFLRLVLCHHTTFFINSLAHYWGKQPYSDANSAKDNSLIALLTCGEGYHNYHHTFQWDYRNGIRWYHFDPTKWLIASLSRIRLASNLKVATPEKIEKLAVRMQLKAAIEKVLKFKSKFKSIDTEPWLALLETEYHQLITAINDWSVCRQQWLKFKHFNLLKHWEDTDLAAQLRQLEMNLHRQRRQWRILTRQFA